LNNSQPLSSAALLSKDSLIGIVNPVSDCAPPALFKACCALLGAAQSLGIPIVNGPTSQYDPNPIDRNANPPPKFNITIIPEIDLPGHGGGWAPGIPSMIVPCPKFLCGIGYGIPINIGHAQVRSILKDVLQEVLEIFDQPPFLHLGGDDLHLTEPCWQEAEMVPNYPQFESNLAAILQDLNYPVENVIR
jgi:hypothetical protein